MSTASRVALLALVAVLSGLAQTGGAPASTVSSGALVPAQGSPYIIGPQPSAVASGDFNGDGLPDLVVANGALSFTLRILLATHGGGFVPASGNTMSIGEVGSVDLAVADFNGDGILDIAALGQLTLTIFIGDGQGGFSPTPASPINIYGLGLFGADAIAVGDFNGDHEPDLAVVDLDAAGDILILLGDGKGNFTTAPDSPLHTGQAAKGVTVADFNMDGNLDLAITYDAANQVGILLGDGMGRFSPDPKGPFPTGQLPFAIVHGDFNGDGNVDLAVANWFVNTMTILLGDGTGGFASEPDITIASGYTPGRIAVGDIDGDGTLDLVVPESNASAGNLLILLGDGKGGFQFAASGELEIPGGSIAITLADFNGDARLDVATADFNGGTASAFLGAASAASSLTLSASANPTVGVPFSVTVAANTSGFRAPNGTVTVRDGATVVGTGDLIDGAATLQTTLSTAAAHTLVAVYLGDLRTTGSASPPLTINVAKGSQTISFPTLPKHAYGDPPFTVPASSSSGLPVTLTVVSGPATIAGNVLTLIGTGLVTLQASQPGNGNYLPAPNVQQQLQVGAPLLQIDAVGNAASYGAGSFAAGSFAVVFGVDLASPATSSGSLTPTLGGTSIRITDASGKASNALLYYASPAQINLILPSGLSPGTATLTVQTQTGLSTMTSISIAAVDPGLFSADASGTGVAAGSALRVSADGTQTQLAISSCGGQPLVCTAIPIDLGTDTDTVYLSLYGTGIRGRSALAAVTATIGGIATDVQYAGAQPAYPGLDQVNLKLNPALRGRGSVQVALTVDGTAANVVTVTIQ
jgi:uncharacterized protein (TIGR03437 family)